MSVKPTRAQQMANEDSAEVARVWAKRCATLERELVEARATIAALTADVSNQEVREKTQFAESTDYTVHTVAMAVADVIRGRIPPPAQDSATEKL